LVPSAEDIVAGTSPFYEWKENRTGCAVKPGLDQNIDTQNYEMLMVDQLQKLAQEKTIGPS